MPKNQKTPSRSPKRSLDSLLRSRPLFLIQVFLYFSVLFLWFKDNFYQFRDLSFPLFVPLIPLCLILAAQIFLFLRRRLPHLRIVIPKSSWILVLLLILAFSIRLPFLIHYTGWIDSDDAVMALMAKHIADGNVPPVSFYGQHRLGSLLAHGFALVSLLFGFSIPILRACALLFFLGFLVVQFLLLKRIFSAEFASLGCLFLSLPLGDLMKISLDLAAGFSLMLFFGSLIIYLAYMVYYNQRDDLTPFLAFTMGLAFWSHQMTIPFSGVAALFIFLRHKFRIKEYISVVALFIVGAFPFFLYEIMTGFATSNILFSGEKFAMNPTKFSWTVKTTGYMMSSLYNISSVLWLIPVFIGVAFPIYISLKRRKLLADNVYALFLGAFLLIYFSSAYSNAFRIRYLYPLYFSIPILYLYLFPYIKKTALRYIGLIILIFIVLLPNNINAYVSQSKNAVEKTAQLEEVVAFLDKSGQKFWLSEYWNAYLMTALAKEDVLVVSYTNKKYRPYQLFYSLNREKTNYLFRLDKKEFAWQAGILRKLLDRFDIKHKRKRLNEYLLIYDIEPWIPPFALSNPLPEKFPALTPHFIEKSKSHWTVHFRVQNPPRRRGFLVYITIPNHGSVCANLDREEREVQVEIPVPEKKDAALIFYIDFAGIPIPQSYAQLDHDQIPSTITDKKKNILYLSGISPPVELRGEPSRLCSPLATLLILNDSNLPRDVTLHLYSQFNFRSPFWYGNYKQFLWAYLNDDFVGTYNLQEGDNTISIPLVNLSSDKKTNTLTLRFKYFLPMKMRPVGPWDASAFLVGASLR